MIQVADNFNYRGKKPNFDRDSFDTLQDMKNYSENSLDDGHISYCKNDESLRGTVFDFSISSGTSEEPKYCINFADSYSSGIERITIHSNSVQELKDNRDLIDGERIVEEIWTVRYNNTYIRGVRGGNINLVKFMKISDYAYVLNSGANHNNINFTTLRSGIGSYKKDYSDKNSKYYTIYMQGECNACDINLNITSNNILDSTTENISFIARGILLDQNFSGVNNKFNINREDINLVSSIRNNTLVKDIVKYIDYKDIPTLNMVANLGGVSIEYIKGKPVISGDMYVSKMGTTQERPANIINKGFQYFDTTINKPIFWDGAKWIDATGATV